MQQTCSRCGAVATVPSKFCRQCGASLPVESEAATRQYGRQTPASEPPSASHPFTSPGQTPPSVADAFAADTSRLHNQPPPMGQPFGPPGTPAPFTPPYPVQPPPKSNWWKWVLGLVLVTVLVCGGLVAYTVQRASVAGSQIKKQIEEEIARTKKEAEEAAKQGGAPGGLPGAPPPPPGKGISPEVEALAYPNAKQASKVNALGQQVLTLKTTDSLDKLKTFYTEKLGAPLVESEEAGEHSLVFQKAPLMVTIGPDRQTSGQWEITIIRSGLIPQLTSQ
jgi:hypothetical protein